MIAEIEAVAARPPLAGPAPVMASTVTTEVIEVPELVMKALEPSITHSSPSSRAVVRMPPGMSDPPPGSVRPKAAEPLAAAQRRQPFLLLRGGAEAVDRHRAERDARLQGDGHRRVDPGQLVQGQAEGEVVTAHPV